MRMWRRRFISGDRIRYFRIKDRFQGHAWRFGNGKLEMGNGQREFGIPGIYIYINLAVLKKEQAIESSIICQNGTYNQAKHNHRFKSCLFPFPCLESITLVPFTLVPQLKKASFSISLHTLECY